MADTLKLAQEVISACQNADIKVACAESCTGGLIAGCLTAVPGASEVVERGFVAYANEAKSAMLGVDPGLIAAEGAVSEPVAVAMAEGALENSFADLSVAVTGIAGPGGGTAEKPVGLVHMAAARQGRKTRHQRHIFDGDRESVRRQAVKAALALLKSMI